jgi:hypothetical protein
MKRLSLLAVIAPIIVIVANAYAEDLRLSNLNVSNTHDDLVLNLQLEGAFTDRIQQAILNGDPTTFKFIVTLSQVKNLWIDDNIADFVVIHTVRYDNATKEFSVTRSWRGSSPEKTRSFQEAQQLMSVIDRLSIIPLNELEPGHQYQLKTKAVVRQQTLPLNLHRVLFFVSIWDFATDWYTIDFIF